MYKPKKQNLICANCEKEAYTVENGKPKCFGLWMTWGCHYALGAVEYDRRHFYPTDNKNRAGYQAVPLDYKEKKKLIKRIEELEEDLWMPISRTPHKELLRWHDEKLKTELRILEQAKISHGS